MNDDLHGSEEAISHVSAQHLQKLHSLTLLRRTIALTAAVSIHGTAWIILFVCDTSRLTISATQQALVSGDSLRQQQSPSLVGSQEGFTVGGWG